MELGSSDYKCDITNIAQQTDKQTKIKVSKKLTTINFACKINDDYQLMQENLQPMELKLYWELMSTAHT